MRKFIITSTDIDYLFELVNGNTVRRVKTLFEEQNLPPEESDEQLFLLGDLPREITYRIVKQYLRYLFKNAHFDLAFELLCIDRYFVNQMYYAIYGFSNTTFGEKVKHLSWTFRACMEIYDYVLTAPNLDRHDYYALTFEYQGAWNVSDNHPFHPWDFDISTMQLIAIEPPLLEQGTWDVTYHAFHPGTNFGDMVWLHGSVRKGIFRALDFMRPVIPILLRDRRNRLLRITNSRQSSYFFYCFAHFLRICFGSTTHIFFAVEGLEHAMNPLLTSYVFVDALKCVNH